MVVLGIALSSEEHGPRELVEQARTAERAGFEFAVVSDHFHPWVTSQGNSPFVWGVLGGIAMATDHIQVGTAVTCPIMRIHPAIVAQAAATAAAMLPGRFMLGVGSGELLNEHVVGVYWPPPAVRIDMLSEAIDIIRDLWTGEEVNHQGSYFVVDRARIFTLPEKMPPIIVGATGPTSARLAARHDGMMLMSPAREAIETFNSEGGAGKPRFGQIGVSWAENDAEARRNAFEAWPNAAVGGPLNSDVATPGTYDAMMKLVTEDDVAGSLTCGSSAQPFLDVIQEYADAGVTHVCLHAVGRNPQAFMEFCASEILPQLAAAA